MTTRKDVMYAFAIESDVPTEDLIAKYVATYPQYEEDIRYLAAELQRMHGIEDEEVHFTAEQQNEFDESVKRLMFKFYEKLYEIRGQKVGKA
jgi:hypothetical protein